MLANRHTPARTPAGSVMGFDEQQQLAGEGHPTRAATPTYAELKRLVRQAGLFDPQPVFYTFTILSTLGLLALGAAFLALHPPLWLQLLDAVFLAFIFTQFGFLFHDACHRALARDGRRNALFGLIFGNILTGISRAWWTDNHNAHHSHPNEVDLDPNIEIPILAFSEEQARGMRGPARFIVAHQHIFLFPIFCLQGFNMLIQSVIFLWRSPDARRLRTELPLLVLHYALYLGLILLALGPLQGALFIVVHQALIGLYAGSVFAPNHKGMPVLERDADVDFLHQQVLTSRNVRGHPVTDLWFGGLNYQIEHHLFPTMPRNRLGAAQAIVRSYCAAHGIAYYETGMITSYREILWHFRDIGAVLRT